MSSNEYWVRVRFQDGKKLECRRAQLYDSDVQTTLSEYHLEEANCLCGTALQVQIVHEPSERRFITRAKPNEQELHSPRCGAVTNIRGSVVSTQATEEPHDFSYRAERAFDESYFAQCRSEIHGLEGFCAQLVASMGGENLSSSPERKFYGGVCENEDAFLSFAPNAPDVAMLQLSVWNASDGRFNSSAMPVKMGTPVGGRLESFGHPIRGLFLWLAEVDREALTVEALHVWPIVVAGEYVHSVHSESERALALRFHQLGLMFVKPPSQLFLKNYRNTLRLPQTEQLVRNNVWPDYLVCINSRWCAVELGGIHDWMYLIRMLKKRRIYSELSAVVPDFSWVMLVPNERGEFFIEYSSDDNPMAANFRTLLKQ